MTNYEWLLKENKLKDFLGNISRECLDTVHEIWHIPCYGNGSTGSFYDIIDWLQAEHKGSKWVRLDEVSDIIYARIFYAEAKSLNAEISKLETKEIYN